MESERADQPHSHSLTLPPSHSLPYATAAVISDGSEIFFALAASSSWALLSVGTSLSSMYCSSFEMQSLFMLVCRAWASWRSDSCMLLGSRTVITRVGSFSSCTGQAVLPQRRQHGLDGEEFVGLLEVAQFFQRRKRLADHARQTQHVAVERDPIGVLPIELLRDAIDLLRLSVVRASSNWDLPVMDIASCKRVSAAPSHCFVAGLLPNTGRRVNGSTHVNASTGLRGP